MPPFPRTRRGLNNFARIGPIEEKFSENRCKGLAMSYADDIFKANCREILEKGCSDAGYPVRPRWEDGSPAYTLKRFALCNRYDLALEFPLMTLRRINYRAAVDEILWIWQKKSNNIQDLSSHIWDAWADENGSIGKAYGYQLGVKHHFPDGDYDQVDMLLKLLKENPLSRRMVSNLFAHCDLSQMRLYPCAYSLTLNVTEGRLNGLLNQRSQDMLVANNWNVCQYAALLLMFAQVSGLSPGELVHMIADAHIYERHIPLVEQLLSREGFPAPRVGLDPGVADFYAFTTESFWVENYQAHEFAVKIPVAI